MTITARFPRVTRLVVLSLMLTCSLQTQPAQAAPAIDLPRLPGMPALGVGGIPHWIHPLHPFTVSRAYNMKANRYAAGSHRGIDLRVVPGTPILAPAAGQVIFMGPTPAGFAITVQAGLVRYTFLPVAPIPEDLLVVPGALVAPQEPLVLGLGIGHRGCLSCVHFSVRNVDNGYLDPMTFFATPETVLMTPR